MAIARDARLGSYSGAPLCLHYSAMPAGRRWCCPMSVKVVILAGEHLRSDGTGVSLDEASSSRPLGEIVSAPGLTKLVLYRRVDLSLVTL